MNSSKISFFKLNPASNELIAMGTGSEAGFFVLAIAIVDHIASSPTSSQPLLEHLFQSYQKTFPLPKLREKSMNAKVFFAHFLHTPGSMLQFIPEVAHLLKEMVIESLQINNNEVAFNDAALYALSSRLGWAIVLRITEDKKELPLKWSYRAGGAPLKALVVQLEGDSYQVSVNKPELFRLVAPGKYFLQVARKMPVSNEGLSHRAQQIQKNYEDALQCLSTMVKLGETTKENLLNCYIHHLPSDLAGFRQYDENFFKKTNTSPFTSFNDEIIKALIEALARNIAINLISEDVLEELAPKGKRLKVG